jgi:SAM-dependent methyltransferase
MSAPAPVAHRAGRETDADYLLPELTAAEPWHFWFQARRELILWAVRRYFAAARRVLDLGCGTGFILEGLERTRPGATLAGCDAQPASLAVARQRLHRTVLFQADAERLPCQAAFDLILALDVLEHISADGEALAAMVDALRPRGGVIITVPQHPALWSEVDDFSCHRRRYTRRTLLDLLRPAGLELVRCTSVFAVTLPALAVSRWRPRKSTFDPATELRIGRPINALLRAAMRLESAAIRGGLTLPAGGSLLAIARRP